MLNYAGRLELISSTIQSIFSYWLKSLLIPKKVLDKIDTMCANFLWKNGQHHISWKSICRPKEAGGLGIRSCRKLYKAVCLQRLWTLLTGHGIWSKWMRSRYKVNASNIWDMHIDNNASSIFKSILNIRDLGLKTMRKKISNGEDTNLWCEPWLDSGRLVDLLGRDVISRIGDAQVANIIRNGAWSIQPYPCLRPYFNQISDTEICSNHQTDFYEWKPSAHFSFKAAYTQCFEHTDAPQWHDIVWSHCLSKKMSICSYRAMVDRLPTKSRLISHGTQLNPLCVLCNSEAESRDHLYYKCRYTSMLWSQCRCWLGLQQKQQYDLLEEGLEICSKFRRGCIEGALARGVFRCGIWHLWIERNIRTFDHRERSVSSVLATIRADVQSMLNTSFLKLGYGERGKELCFRWKIQTL